MKLYYKAGACSLASHILLCELGMDYLTESVDLSTKVTETGANFFEVNPKGQVPTLLLDDGSYLTEGVAILQYLADQTPEQTFFPRTGLARYQTISWLNYIATELHKSFSPLYNPKASEDTREAARQNLHNKFTYLEQVLSQHAYLQGEYYGIADMYLFVVLNWCSFTRLDLTPFSTLSAYIARIAARSAVQQALKEEGLV